MRTIQIPLSVIVRGAAENRDNVRSVIVPVIVDWPELQLTEEQTLENALARSNGAAEPFPNPAMFGVEILND